MDKKHDLSNLFPKNEYDKWYKKDGEKVNDSQKNLLLKE